MIRVQLPFLFLPTREARDVLGARAGMAAACAFREIARAARSLDIQFLQFAFQELTLAVCSRVRGDGLVEIEAGIGDARLPRCVFTAEQAKRVEQEALARGRLTARQARERPNLRKAFR
jgi:hypothetical protein